LVILYEENHENIRALEAGCVHWNVKKLILVIITEENHENIRALEAGCVHWHMKITYIGNPF
jgi:nitrite reductase/ring-hydroxylating ferredoxin subunit